REKTDDDVSLTGSVIGYYLSVRKPIHLRNNFFAVTPILSYSVKGSAGSGGIFNFPAYKNKIHYLQATLPIGPFVRGLTYDEEVPIEKSQNVSAGIGPYIALATGGASHLENTTTDEMEKRKLSFGNSVNDDFKRID